MVDLDGVSAGYGAGDVLHEVSLNVHEGEIVVILGANGAGKTTLMRTISGTIARRGRIAFEGVDISSFAPDRIVRLGVAQVPQGRGTLVDLTVEENLRAGALSREGRSTVKADIERWFGVYPSLAERERQKAGLLSGGEQQMLAISRAMMSRPKLLLCDEPSLGLSPRLTQELFASLKSISEEWSMAMLIVEQNVSIALSIATRGYLLEVGSIAGAGDAAQLGNSDSVPCSIPRGVGAIYHAAFPDPTYRRTQRGRDLRLPGLGGLRRTYRGSRALNLAQGEMAMFCTYIVWDLIHNGFTVIGAIAVGVLVGAVGGGVIERTLIRPLGRKADYSVLLVTIGLFLAIDATAGVIWVAIQGRSRLLCHLRLMTTCQSSGRVLIISNWCWPSYCCWWYRCSTRFSGLPGSAWLCALPPEIPNLRCF